MKEIHFESIDSTNLYLKQNYQKLEDRTFVSADYQTKGKGRNDRSWQSCAGENLLFSLLIREAALFPKYKAMSILSAYTILQVLKEYKVSSLSIKWPNDIYVKDHKICGILLESVMKERMECLIIGIGLNVNQKVFTGDYLHPPVSLYQLLNKETEIDEIKEKCYQKLMENLESLKLDYDFYPEIRKYDYLKGKRIQYNEIDYIVKGINPDLTLKITNENDTRDVESGEISFHTYKGDK